MYEWVISLIAALAAVGALWFTAKSFRRLRKTEQVRLSESILRDVRNSINEFNILSSETVLNTEQESIRKRKLDRFLDHAFETLNWHCLLIEIGEINDERLLEYFKRIIIKWHDDLFVKYIGVEIVSGETYPNFRKVYQRFKNEDKAKSGENKSIFKYLKFLKLWRLKISYR
jgi:hypothetical protein